VRLAWHVVVPEVSCKWNWHHELLCSTLEASLRGECPEFVFNVSPGSTKSLITSVFWPAFVWGPGKWPTRRMMFACFDIVLARRDSDKCKALVTSRWYQERWGFQADRRELQRMGLQPITTSAAAAKQKVGGDQVITSDGSEVWYTSASGMRMAVSVAGKGTGWHVHDLFVDDPTKPKTIQKGGDNARAALGETTEWWSGTMASRRVDPANFVRGVVMQRLHTEDLAGVCIKDGYRAIIIPMEFDPARRCVTPWGSDPRTQPGELMWPEHVTPDALASLKKSLAGHVSSQLQQLPLPEGGSIWKPEWLRQRWRSLPKLDKWWQSWDCTFSEAGQSYVVGQVWGKKGPDYYLIDQVRRRMGFVDTCEAMRLLSLKWPKARRKLVEKKANGAAVMDAMKALGGLVAIEPSGGKISRANACSEIFETNNVWLPDDAPWLQEYIDELLAFPQGANDDQVDCTTQSLNHAESSGAGAAGLLAAYG
jgi:predicted phage terminase large subunit-like protein